MKCAVQIYMVLGGFHVYKSVFWGGWWADLTLRSMGSITVVFHLQPGLQNVTDNVNV